VSAVDTTCGQSHFGTQVYGISDVMRSYIGCCMRSSWRIARHRLNWPGMRQQGLIMYRTLGS